MYRTEEWATYVSCYSYNSFEYFLETILGKGQI